MWDSCAICMFLFDEFDINHKLLLKEPKFRAKFYEQAFYASGTVDNLTASSSPINLILKDKKTG